MTHLREIPGTDDIDVHAFWTFSHPTPGPKGLTTDAGHRFWGTVEPIADAYPCHHCKPGAQAITHGGHDSVSLLLGKRKQPFTPTHFDNLYDMVVEAHGIWENQGHIHKKKSSTKVTHRVNPHIE